MAVPFGGIDLDRSYRFTKGLRLYVALLLSSLVAVIAASIKQSGRWGRVTAIRFGKPSAVVLNANHLACSRVLAKSKMMPKNKDSTLARRYVYKIFVEF